jgi:signal transduction histidine kinase
VDRPLVDRVGAMIGFFYFLVSITLAAVLGYAAWWVNIMEQPAALGYAGIALGAVLLLFLPRLPRQTFVACGVLAFLLYGAGVLLGLPTVLMALVALFGITLWTDRRSGLWALAASLGSLAVAVLLLFLRYGFYLPPLETFLTDRVAIFLFNSSGVVVLTWAIADQIRAVRERRALQRESAAHAADAAAHQVAEQAARGQVEALADRQRIAREMHDIVAHGLSVMIVQADGARFAAAKDPDAATAALATIASTGRSSLAEMRRLLSVLRDDTAPALEGPQPGLGDIPGLVRTIAETGRDVRLSLHGDLPDTATTDAVGLTAYRTVQEALTNVMKHAGDDATAWVTVNVGSGRVVVEVLDNGPGDGQTEQSGHGLRGMAERVEMVGGHLVTGTDPRGGFRVLATLPWPGGEADA